MPVSISRVQIVEGDESSLTVAAAVRARGFDVCVAPSAADAMNQYFDAQPEVVVVDIGWHAEDMFEYCRQLRKLRSSERLRIIGLLAASLRDCEPLALEAGIDVCLAKSADPRDLLQSLSEVGCGLQAN